jgi:hypothetical protein
MELFNLDELLKSAQENRRHVDKPSPPSREIFYPQPPNDTQRPQDSSELPRVQGEKDKKFQTAPFFLYLKPLGQFWILKTTIFEQKHLNGKEHNINIHTSLLWKAPCTDTKFFWWLRKTSGAKQH